MRARHPGPWLMTDERIADLAAAVRRLPRGGGIVFRHHATSPDERRRLFARLRPMARARGLLLVRAGPVRFAGESGVHGSATPGLFMLPVHDVAEARRARRWRAPLVLVSPVFPTRSHPGAPALGPRRAQALARLSGRPAVALGGMDARRFARLPRGFVGWAAIDAFA